MVSGRVGLLVRGLWRRGVRCISAMIFSDQLL